MVLPSSAAIPVVASTRVPSSAYGVDSGLVYNTAYGIDSSVAYNSSCVVDSSLMLGVWHRFKCRSQLCVCHLFKHHLHKVNCRVDLQHHITATPQHAKLNEVATKADYTTPLRCSKWHWQHSTGKGQFAGIVRTAITRHSCYMLPTAVTARRSNSARHENCKLLLILLIPSVAGINNILATFLMRHYPNPTCCSAQPPC